MSELNCTSQPDLDCPKFDSVFISWLNTLKSKVYEMCECLKTVCEPVRLLDLSAAGDTRTGFVWNQSTPTEVNSSVDGLDVTVNISSLASGGLMTFSFSKPVCAFSMVMFDVDTDKEMFTGWSIAPDSISPPYGSLVNSTLTWNNLPNVTSITVNSNYLFDNNNTFAPLAPNGFWLVSLNADGSVGSGVQVRWDDLTITECSSDCFDAQKCTTFGVSEYRDLNDDVLGGNYEEC